MPTVIGSGRTGLGCSASTRDSDCALIVSHSGPGPMMSSDCTMLNWPWVNVIVAGSMPGENVITPPDMEVAIASRSVQVLLQLPGPASLESLTTTTAADAAWAQPSRNS